VNSDLKKFLDILPSHLGLVLLRFRCMNHKLPTESGKFCNIPREFKVCNLCNTSSLGDE
jgi:hypothetical protein